MTREEVKQLKTDDEIFIRAKYVRTLYDGDVIFHFPTSDGSGKVTTDERYAHPSCVIFSPPAPKYDPCRLFKKGDKVRVVERNGRNFWNASPETIYTVVADEYLHDDRNVLLRGCVGLNDGKPETCSSWNVPFFHVELVTPVEELEPYFVMELKGAYGVYNTRFQPETEACHFFTDMHPNAKEAAEAECARLNAEHRKEQS